tara:strand:- start:38 stop:499 length:462 start_codon:yes stop_codon:yes gene_type:complete
MDRSSSIEEFKISDQTVDDLLETLEIFKQKNISVSDTCTKNGFQTSNILEYEAPKELSRRIMKEINKNLNLFHIHLIDYFNKGYQTPHNHEKTEDFSFILYLNDSDGNTVFENIDEISPKKGKLIFFKSNIWHFSKPSLQEKKIAVGAFKSVA